jgi:SAM-dependent methyltransferase
VNFRRNDAEAPDLPETSFDLIVERHVLWTLPHPEAALDNWRHLLRQNGRLVLIEGHWEGMAPRDEYTKICDQLPLFGGRPADEIVEVIRASGFSFVTAAPLMEPQLWIEPPTHPRYLITAYA